MNAQQKYKELITKIQILSIRASQEKKQEVNEKLKRISTYLEEVRVQRFLCQLSEKDRKENKRYKEILELIDEKYDGTGTALIEICKTLNKREDDINEVLKVHDKKSEKIKEEER